MGRTELIESLRARAAEDVETLWRETRARADAYRAELAQQREQLRGQLAATAAAALQKREAEASADARHRARELRAAAVLALADRLHSCAVAQLPRLRSEQGADLFANLVHELPRREWNRVRVNPADRALAQGHFPGAEVVSDEGITGGLAAEADSGRIRVSNTLETRLATAWPDILPGLVSTLLPESHGRGTAA